MKVIDCFVMRMAIFFLLRLIWMSIDGAGYAEAQSFQQPSTTRCPERSTEAESSCEIRPVNLIIINEKSNEIANQSVTNALKTIEDTNPNLIGRVITITIDGADPTADMEKICAIWDAAIVEDSAKLPHLALDTTRVGSAAKTVTAFTAAVGIPTLSAQFSRVEDNGNWRYLDVDQKKYLVQVAPPTDLIPEAIRQLTLQMNITNAGVIFDESFVMDHKYDTLFANVLSSMIMMPTKQSPDEIRRILLHYRDHSVCNYFVLGGEKTIRTVMNIGESLNLTEPIYGWYALTEDDFEPRCDCKNVSLLIFKPLISSASKRSLADLALPAESPLTSSFYYDLVRLATTAMSQSIARGAWPMNTKHIGCDAFDGENTPIREFDYFKELDDASMEFQPTFADIVWGRKNNRLTAGFSMTAEMVTFAAGKPISSKDVGIWRAELNSDVQVKDNKTVKNHLGVRIYRVSVIIKPPFVMYDPKTKVWSGYSIDVMNRLSSICKFSFAIQEAHDKRAGMMDEHEAWNRMMEDLQHNKVDIALGPLTMMPGKDDVVEFTLPYYDLIGFSLLMKKPKGATSLFKFLDVFDADVWWCIFGCYFIASILMWIFERWSPYGYRKNGERLRNNADRKRVFDFGECLWFSLTSLTPQGGGEVPIHWSSCIVAGTWWFFGFIITASYTANLGAFLTVTRLETPIQSLDDLSDQYKIQYAPINGSATHLYFERMARIEDIFDRVWLDINLNKSMNHEDIAKLAIWDYPVTRKYKNIYEAMKFAGFPADMDEALRRIRAGSSEESDEFVLVGDAAEIQYLEMTNCDLLMVGEEFSRRPCVIALPRGSHLKEDLNMGIREMRYYATLNAMKTRWWDENPKKKVCSVKEKDSDSIRLTNIGGLFFLILAGTLLCCLILAVECCRNGFSRGHKKQSNRNNAIPERAVEKPVSIKITVKPAKNVARVD